MVRLDKNPAGLPELPVPSDDFLWPKDFAERVDAYRTAHEVTLAETFRRISEATGNSPKGISLRYYGPSRKAREAARIAATEPTGCADELPLPDGGIWPYDFTRRVDAYRRHHRITLAETFRRISDATGNSPNGLKLRYYRK